MPTSLESNLNLTILQLNDLHGYLESHWEMVREEPNWTFKKMGGLARIATVFKEARKFSGGAVLTLDNGDTFHGTYVSTVDKGLSMVPLMNALEFDAMTTHWEFAYGPEGVKTIEDQLTYPMLAINCYYKTTDKLFFKPYKIIERNGLKIAVIGLACPIVDKTMPPTFYEGLKFTTGNEELPSWIKVVKEKEAASIVVILSHLGFPQDVQLAKDVSGIDILVSGHTHNRMNHAIIENGTIIFQSGCHGSFIGKLDVKIKDKKVVSFEHSLISINETIEEDAQMKRLVDVTVSPHRQKLKEVVGETSSALHRYSMLSAPMDDILLEAIMETAKTEIAFSNGWRYGAPIPPGKVTVEDLWNIIPVNPPIQTVEMTGAELLKMLEENLERTFSAKPYEQMGGYVKRMRGITLYFKAENPKNFRIDRLFVGNDLVSEDKYYSVAFVTSQGVPAKFGRNRRKLEVDAIASLTSLFQSRKTITPSGIQSVFEI